MFDHIIQPAVTPAQIVAAAHQIPGRGNRLRIIGRQLVTGEHLEADHL